jgi:hypothetical protein
MITDARLKEIELKYGFRSDDVGYDVAVLIAALREARGELTACLEQCEAAPLAMAGPSISDDRSGFLLKCFSNMAFNIRAALDAGKGAKGE